MIVDRLNGLLGPYERTRYEVELEAGERPTARELVDRYKDPRWGEPLAAIIDGRVVRGRELEDVRVSEKDRHVVVLPDPQGIEVLTFIAVNILLPALISVGIAYAYAAIVGKPEPPQERGEGEESPTYSWDGIQTGYGAGYRIPIVYGQHRVGGQVVAANIFEQASYEDVLGLYMILSEGPIAKIAGIDVETVSERNDLGGLFNPNPNPSLAITGLRVNGNEIADQRDISASLRAGTLFQSPVPRWPDVTTVYDVNFELRANIWNAYTCVATDVTSLRIRVRFQGLYKQAGNAAINYTVVFGIQFRKTGTSGWSAESRVSAMAARRSRFNWSTVVYFPEPGQWEVRIRRITADDGSDTLSASTWTHVVEAYGAGNGQQLRYPYLATMALMLRATERVQGNAPTVTLPIWGRTINWWTTAGGWQGETFFDIPSSRWIGRNPAWILCDFLTNGRYGLGKWISVDDLVLPNFEDAGNYADVLVPDGKAGTHPRYHFDGVIDGGQPAWEYVLRICRAMQAIPVLVGKKLGLKFEHPDSVSFPRTRNQVFASSNITDVEMTWTDHRSRPNIIDAQILNEETDWQQDSISVEDPDAFGLNEPWRLNAQKVRREGVELFGVTRPAHARRLVYFMHATSRLWKAAIRFRCAIDALAVEVGDVIGVETEVLRFFDQPTQGIRLTRAVSAAAVIYVDEPTTITASSAQSVAVWKTDGTASVHPILAPVGSWPPDSALIIGGGPITCHKGQTVAFGYTDKVVRDFVVTAINITETLEREVEAIIYDEDAFSIPAALALANDDPGTEQPFEMALEETASVDLALYEHGTRGLVTFERPFNARGTEARVYIRYHREKGAVELEDRLSDPWVPVWRGLGDEAEILGLEPGQRYELAVVIEPRDGSWQGPDDVTPFEFVAVEFPTVSPLEPTHRWAAAREQGVELAWNDARHDSTRRYEVRQGERWSGAEAVAKVAAERVWLERAPYNRAGAYYQVRTVAESGLVSEPERPILVPVGVPKCLSLTAEREW